MQFPKTQRMQLASKQQTLENGENDIFDLIETTVSWFIT